MTEKELAELTLTMISSDGLNIPASSASAVAECQAWLRGLIAPEKLKDVSKS